MKFNKGFTLIELLVVIAIIGILATIVLTSLGGAREAATDTKVQGQLSSMRAQAELYYSANGNYGSTGQALGACSTGTLFTSGTNTLANLLDLPSGYYSNCVATPTTGGATAWAVAVTDGTAFNTGASKGWCVDSTGQSVTYSAALTSGQTTTLGTAVCPTP